MGRCLSKNKATMSHYWFMMSIGGWKGFLQLITRPNYWEKTRHGLDLPGETVPNRTTPR